MPSDSKKKRNAKKTATASTNGTSASNGTSNGSSKIGIELSEEGKLFCLVVVR